MKNRKIKSIFVMVILFATLFFVFVPTISATDITMGTPVAFIDRREATFLNLNEMNTNLAVISAEPEDHDSVRAASVSGSTITLGTTHVIGASGDGSDWVKYNSTEFIWIDSDGTDASIGTLSGTTITHEVVTGIASESKFIFDTRLTNSTGGIAVLYLNTTGFGKMVAGYYNGADISWGTAIELSNFSDVDDGEAAYHSGSLSKLDDNEMFVTYKNGTATKTSVVTISGTTSTITDTYELDSNDGGFTTGSNAWKLHAVIGKRLNDTHIFVGYVDSSKTYGRAAYINSTHEMTWGSAVEIDGTAQICNIEVIDTNTILMLDTWSNDIFAHLITISGTTVTEVMEKNLGASLKYSANNIPMAKVDTNKVMIMYSGVGVDDDSYVAIVEYVANAHPVQSNPDPDDEATDIEATPMLNITVNDAEGDSMTVHWLSNSSGSWVEFGSNSSVGNGTYHQTNSNFSGSLTKYWWSVNVTDGNWTNATYSFTTIEVSANSNPFPADNAEDVALEPTIHITVNDSQGDTMNVTFRTNATAETWGDIATNTSVPNGTYYQDSVPFNSYSTKYWWSVNTTDGTTWSNNTYSFTTIANSAPVNSNPVPANAATGTELNPTLYINVSDPESENMDVHWWTNATGSWANFHTDSGVSNSTQNAVTTNMDTLDTKYYWSVNTTDGTNWDNDTYYFTTTATSPNPVNSNPVPANAATNQPFNIDPFNITCNDPNGDTMDISLWTNNTASGNWVKWKYVNGVNNGTNSWVGSHDPYFTDLDGNTKYYWSVNTTDGTNWDNDTYYFTTNHSYSMTITKTANVSTVAATDTVWDTQLVNYTINVTNTGTGELTDININETWWNCSCSDWKFWFISTNEPNWETNLTIYNDSCYMSINITNISAGESYELYILLNISECAIDTEGTLRNWANVTAEYAPAKTSYCDITWGSPPAAKGLAITVADILMVFILVVVIFAILGTLIVLMGKIKF